MLICIYKIQNAGERFGKNILYVIGYSIGYLLLEKNNYQSYIYQTVYTFIILYILCMKQKVERENRLYILCVLLCIYEIIHLFGGLIGVVSICIFFFKLQKTRDIIIIISTIVKIICIFVLTKYIEKKRFEMLKLFHRYKGKMICFIYLLTVCVKIPFLYTDIKEGTEWKVVLLAITFCTVVFFVILQRDRRNAEKEKAWVEEKNKILTAKLHKSQEILPAMVQALSDVTEKTGTGMEEQKAHKLFEEVSNLYEQQIRENVKEDLQLKNFCSTGLMLLDQQLNSYQYEAIEKEINLDIFVQAPIDEVIKNGNINQLRLQRAIGDLVRNAFHAVGRTHEKGGHILLIIGCRYEDILEVAVMDDGMEIPLHVLETFGKRGVTTGGTGNGLADIWEFAREVKASICVDEFEGKADSFTKKISIIFNEQEMYFLNSSRREKVTTTFWKN